MVILIAAGHAASLTGFRFPFIKALRSAGHEVHATAPEDHPEIVLKLAEVGVRFHPLSLSRSGLGIVADWRYRRALERLMRAIGAKGVFAYTHKPVVHALSAAKAAGVAHRVAMITGLGYAFSPGGGLRRRLARLAVTALYRRSLPLATALFFQNPDDAEVFRHLGLLRKCQAPRIIAGSGVPLDDYPPAPVPAGPPVYLMLARLLADKGVREYAEAAAEVRRRVPGARCLLGGGFDSNPAAISREELQSWTDTGAIEYLGHLADVRPALRACTVFVLPSYREGTPRSVLEALATGRPIITTDAPGCRETVLNPGPPGADGSRRCENGWLVPVGDAGALAEAMVSLAPGTADLAALSAASRLHAERKYDVRLVNQELISAFPNR